MPSGNSGEMPGENPEWWYVVLTNDDGQIVVPGGTTVKVTPTGDLVVCTDGGDSRAGWASGHWVNFRRQQDVTDPTEGGGALTAETSAPTTTSTDGAEDSPSEVPF